VCWKHSFPFKKYGQFKAEYMNKLEQLHSSFFTGPTSSSVFPPRGQERAENTDTRPPANYVAGRKKTKPDKKVFLTI